jgi:hypothetical protein
MIRMTHWAAFVQEQVAPEEQALTPCSDGASPVATTSTWKHGLTSDAWETVCPVPHDLLLVRAHVEKAHDMMINFTGQEGGQ